MMAIAGTLYDVAKSITESRTKSDNHFYIGKKYAWDNIGNRTGYGGKWV